MIALTNRIESRSQWLSLILPFPLLFLFYFNASFYSDSEVRVSLATLPMLELVLMGTFSSCTP